MLLEKSVKLILLFVYVTTTSVWANPGSKCGQNSKHSADPATREGARNSICYLPPIEGSVQCKGYFVRWTYNAKTDKCEKFIYGGCFGTANLFRNQNACLAKCNRKGLNDLISGGSSSSICLQKKDQGNCEALIPSFYFDATSGICKSFNYGGCDGNSNRFPTQQECEQACFYGPQVAASCEAALRIV